MDFLEWQQLFKINMFSSLQHYKTSLEDQNSINLLITNATNQTAGYLVSLVSSTWKGATSPYDLVSTTRSYSTTSTAPSSLAFQPTFDTSTLAPSGFSIIGSRFNMQAGPYGVFIVCDRLCETGGFLGVTGVQTTATPNLPRYTDGRGVMIGLEIKGQLGATSSFVVANYNDIFDVTGITASAMIGATNNREVNRFIIMPLKPGCNGVKKVNSIQLFTMTGTPGLFNVVLFKPLYMIPLENYNNDQVGDYISGNHIGRLNDIPTDSFLFLLSNISDSRGNGTFLIHEEA